MKKIKREEEKIPNNQTTKTKKAKRKSKVKILFRRRPTQNKRNETKVFPCVFE